MKTAFAQNLRKYRKARGLTQTALGKMLHYGSTAIANYESGRNEPSLADLSHLADILGVSVDGLLGRDGAKRQPWENPLLERILELEPRQRKWVEELLFLLTVEKKGEK